MYNRLVKWNAREESHVVNAIGLTSGWGSQAEWQFQQYIGNSNCLLSN